MHHHRQNHQCIPFLDMEVCSSAGVISHFHLFARIQRRGGYRSYALLSVRENPTFRSGVGLGSQLLKRTRFSHRLGARIKSTDVLDWGQPYAVVIVGDNGGKP